MLPPPPPPPDGNRTRIAITIVVLIVVLAVGLFAAWMILQNGRDNPWSAPTPSPSIAPAPTVTPEFSVQTTAGGSNGYVFQGDSIQVTVFVKWAWGDAPIVSLSADTGSSGLQCSFSAGSSRPDFSSVLTITVPYYTNPGYYTVVITGTNGEVSHSTNYSIEVLSR